MVYYTPRPPYEVGLNITASEGFSNISAYGQLLTFLLIARISAALRSTEWHRNHTLESPIYRPRSHSHRHKLARLPWVDSFANSILDYVPISFAGLSPGVPQLHPYHVQVVRDDHVAAAWWEIFLLQIWAPFSKWEKLALLRGWITVKSTARGSFEQARCFVNKQNFLDGSNCRLEIICIGDDLVPLLHRGRSGWKFETLLALWTITDIFQKMIYGSLCDTCAVRC